MCHKCDMLLRIPWLHRHSFVRPLSSLTKERFKILFLGRDEFSCIVFRHLFEAINVWDYLVVATNPDEHIGRNGGILSVSPLKLLGASVGVPVHLIPSDKRAFRLWDPPDPFLMQREPTDDLAGKATLPLDHVVITASFGRILSSRFLSNFAETRRLNVHPSLLPLYRGPAPIQHTLINGEQTTGVCVAQMLKPKEGIDAGPLWGISQMNVPPDADFGTMRSTLAHEGGKLLVDVLRRMLSGEAKHTDQAQLLDAPKAPFILSRDAVVHFASMTAEHIVRRHHAFAHQRPLTAYLPNLTPIQLHGPLMATPIAPPKLLDTPGSAYYDKKLRKLFIRCAEGTILMVLNVKELGKGVMEVKDWYPGAKSFGHFSRDNVMIFRDMVP